MSESGNAVTPSPSRRHDLDALRASAMLLGIAYHIALSFAAGLPWLVRDDQQSGGFMLFQYALHGFRMPLFFLLSGFFTAMLWRKRGLSALIGHRFRRVLLPCLIGLVTVVPVMFVVANLAIQSGARDRDQPPPSPPAVKDIWKAVATGDVERVKGLLAEGADVNQRHPASGVTPLTLAALFNQLPVAQALLDHGADVNARDDKGATPLHAAALFGRAEIVRRLIERGADVHARNQRGETPASHAVVDWGATEAIAKSLQMPVAEVEVRQGRERALALLRAAGASPPPAQDGPPQSWVRGLIAGLTLFPLFSHLWFLWFLWWLVLLFSIYFLVAGWRGWRGAPDWLVLSPARLLWLVPLTMLPQGVMESAHGGFGPDTSLGLLPMPHVFLYYAIFFGFGVLYHDADDASGRVGQGWRWSLPVALLIVFPLALEVSTGAFGFRNEFRLGDLRRPLAVGLQALYAWLMTFACMGLFRALLTRENRAVRWLSDSAYWLYIAHLPLVILAQLWVRDWPVAATLKFAFLNVVVIGFLLLTYQWMVRYTWLGRLLNGPRARPMASPAFPAAAAPSS